MTAQQERPRAPGSQMYLPPHKRRAAAFQTQNTGEQSAPSQLPRREAASAFSMDDDFPSLGSVKQTDFKRVAALRKATQNQEMEYQGQGRIIQLSYSPPPELPPRQKPQSDPSVARRTIFNVLSIRDPNLPPQIYTTTSQTNINQSGIFMNDGSQ